MADQQSLLALLHSYASERLHGERAVEELKTRNSVLTSEIENARMELEDAKSKNKSAEEHLKGLQIELAAIETAIKSRQIRVQFQQEEIAKAKNEKTALEEKERLSRESFLAEMLDFKEKIRNMRQYYTESNFKHLFEQKSAKLVSDKETANNICQNAIKHQEAKLTDSVGDVDENSLAAINLQIEQKRKEEEALANDYRDVLKRKENTEQRVTLMEAIMHSTQAFEGMSKQTAQLESLYASSSDQLQGLCVCPNCGNNNIDMIESAVCPEEEKLCGD